MSFFPKLLLLPHGIIGEVLSTWMDPLALCLLDTALCSKDSRPVFIDELCKKEGFLISPYVWIASSKDLVYYETCSFHNWINLREIKMKEFQICNHNFTHLVPCALKNSLLNSVDTLILKNCVCFSEVGCERFVTYLERCPRISVISFQNCVVSDLVMCFVPLTTWDGLTTLKLLLPMSSNVTRLSIEVIAGNCKSLCAFELDCLRPQDSAFTEWGFIHLVKENVHLTRIQIACNVVLTDAFLCALAGRNMIHLSTVNCLPAEYSLRCIGGCLAEWMNSLEYCQLILASDMQVEHYGWGGPNLLIIWGGEQNNISELMVQLSGYGVMKIRTCRIDADVFDVICVQNPNLHKFVFGDIGPYVSNDILSDFVANCKGLDQVTLTGLQEVHSNLRGLIASKMGKRYETIKLDLC